MRSVAIVGSHPISRDGVPFDDPNLDVWVFNEAAALPWAKKISACFQMHKPPIWKNPNNLNFKDYPKWISEKHDFPIYMLDQYDEVPSCTKYPFDEVTSSLLGKMSRSGKEKIKSVFSSSIAYAFALALYLKYDRILIFGVEMDSNTEYTFQRSDAYFWIGVAVGRGVEVILQENSKILTGLLYGFEGDVTLSEEEIQKRVTELNTHKTGLTSALDKINEEQKQVLEKSKNGDKSVTADQYLATVKKQAETVMALGTFEGSIRECSRYLEKAKMMDQAAGKNLFARQEFERTGAVIQEQIDLHRQNISAMATDATNKWQNLGKYARYNEKSKKVQDAVSEYSEAHQKYLDAAFKYGMAIGVLQENIHFMNKIDEFIRAAGGEKARLALTAQPVEGEKL